MVKPPTRLRSGQTDSQNEKPHTRSHSLDSHNSQHTPSLTPLAPHSVPKTHALSGTSYRKMSPESRKVYERVRKREQRKKRSQSTEPKPTPEKKPEVVEKQTPEQLSKDEIRKRQREYSAKSRRKSKLSKTNKVNIAKRWDTNEIDLSDSDEAEINVPLAQIRMPFHKTDQRIRFTKKNLDLVTVLPKSPEEAVDVMISVFNHFEEDQILLMNSEKVFGVTFDKTKTWKKSKLSNISRSTRSRISLSCKSLLDTAASEFMVVYAACVTLKKKISACKDKDLALHICKLRGLEVSITEAETREGNQKFFRDSEWPDKIRAFMTQQPVSRIVPGYTVSVKYGKREQKFVRQMTNKEAYSIFKKANPTFRYSCTKFSSAVPKNVVCASADRDVIQNVCVIHANVKRMVKGLNNFIIRSKLDRSLLLPTSGRELSSMIICQSNTDFDKDSVTTWNLACCIGKTCAKCGAKKILQDHLQKVKSEQHIGASTVKFSSWQYVNDDSKDKKIQILKTQQEQISKFYGNFLIPAMSKLPLHTRTMVIQWNVFKSLPASTNLDTHQFRIRTREDFQEDLSVLLREETVSTHRGQGKITMTLYPVAVEVADSDSVSLHALIFVGNKTKKSFSTVHHYEKLVISHFENKLGKKCKDFQRMSDGCAAQFWGYGSYASAILLKEQKQLDSVMFSRYAASEGKNLSDAIGSFIKRICRAGVLRIKDTSKTDEDMLNEVQDGVEADDVEFASYNEFCTWLQQLVENRSNKGFDKFKSLTLKNVDNDDIVQYISEEDVKKVKGLKTFHCFYTDGQQSTSTVNFRDSTCPCSFCLEAKYNECPNSKIYGQWVKHDISDGQQNKKDDNYDETVESDVEVLREHDGYSDSSDNDTDVDINVVINTEEAQSHLAPGNVFLVKLEEKVFLAVLDSVADEDFTFRFMRRDFQFSEDEKGMIKFDFPRVSDYMDFKKGEEMNGILVAYVKDYQLGRRGSLLINSVIKQKFSNIH